MKRLLILLMLVSQPAWAEWVKLMESEGGRTIRYIDPATLRKTADGRRVWVMWTHDSPKTHEGTTHRSNRELIEIDCSGERERLLQVEFFSGLVLGGSSVAKWNGTSKWAVPAPNTWNDDRLKFVCRMPLR